MHFKRQRVNDEGINLTPLIDVVFLLLIFFMVSTTFTKETHLQLQLPSAEGEAPPDLPSKIEVIIDAQGGYAVNGENLVNSQINTLSAAIERASGGNTELPFVITADAKVSYERVVTVMDAAGRLGFVNLSMTTITPGAEQ